MLKDIVFFLGGFVLGNIMPSMYKAIVKPEVPMETKLRFRDARIIQLKDEVRQLESLIDKLYAKINMLEMQLRKTADKEHKDGE